MDARFQEAVLPLYSQLREIAQARLAGRDGHTLQATAVVHEALLRLCDRPVESFESERHLLAAAAQAIRHVLVDHARRKATAKRNGGATGRLADGEDVEPPIGLAFDDEARADLAIDLDAALGELTQLDAELRTIVDLHVFGGLPLAEVAALLDSSERTVRRRWAYAAALLRAKLQGWAGNAGERRAETSKPE